MPMNSPFLHCIWMDGKSRLSLTCACEFVFFSQGWTYLVPVWTLFGRVLVPCGLVAHLYLICGTVVDHCWPVAHLWIICSFLYSIGELLVGSLLNRIGFLDHSVIGFSTAIVCVIAVL